MTSKLSDLTKVALEEFDRLYITGDLGIDLSADEHKRRGTVPLKELKAFIEKWLERTAHEEDYKRIREEGAHKEREELLQLLDTHLPMGGLMECEWLRQRIRSLITQRDK